MNTLPNLNSFAKMVLKIKLKSSSSVIIQLVSIDKNYIKTDKTNDYNYYKDERSDFVLWSVQDFLFDKRQLRLPDETNLKDDMVHEYNFENDKERYETLKKLYNTLHGWSLKTNNNRKSHNKQSIFIAGDYWFVS